MTTEKTKATKATKAAIARHICMSTRTLRRLQEEQKLPRDGTLDDFREAHIKRLREEAGGRAGHGDLDLVEQRALLAQKQREHLELRVAILRRDFVPGMEAARQIDLAGQVLLEHFRAAGVRAVPGLMALVDVPAARAAVIAAAMQGVVQGVVDDALGEFERINTSGEFAKLLAPENTEAKNGQDRQSS
jgi:hypothetical protein